VKPKCFIIADKFGRVQLAFIHKPLTTWGFLYPKKELGADSVSSEIMITCILQCMSDRRTPNGFKTGCWHYYWAGRLGRARFCYVTQQELGLKPPNARFGLSL